MSSRRTLLLALALCASACAAPAPGAPAEARAGLAVAPHDLAFRGTVTDVHVEVDPSGLPFTYVTARVDERLAGALDGTVSWRIVGGTLPDGRRVDVADAPAFRVGEEAYWLLALPRTGATRWPVLAGLAAGKWTRRAGALVVSAAGDVATEAELRAALAERAP